jgi:nascent polypeptide-associated complex subunit alpha
MMPGLDPRMMKEAMRRMGIKQTEVDAEQVIIRCKDKQIVIDEPQVMKIDMQGNLSFQISGEVSERSLSAEPELTDDDINTVAEQANVSKEDAKKALLKNKGDIAKTIMELQG